MKRLIIYLELLSLMAGIVLVVFQTISGRLPDAYLKGVMSEAKLPAFSIKSLIDGIWQNETDEWLKDHIGFKGYMVKADNQIYYSIFDELKITTATKIVLGLDDNLFEEYYINTYNNLDRVAEDVIEQPIKQMAELEKKLKDRGKGFLFIISPSKASVYPERIPPERLLPGRDAAPSNYRTAVKYLKQYGVTYFDSLVFFDRLKTEIPVPLFCRGGTHWTEYAAYLAVREIVEALAGQLARPLPPLEYASLEQTDTPSPRDLDLSRLANLVSIKNFYCRAIYQKPAKPADFSEYFQGSALFVGTSFTNEINSVMEQYRLYSSRVFLPYFSRVLTYPKDKESQFSKDPAYVREVIDEADFVVIESNEPRLNILGFGFIETALEALE